MSVYSTVLKRRSIRRFKQKKISAAFLKKLVNAGRLAPSAGNFQPCEFVIVDKNLKDVFACCKWAIYLAPHGTPPEGRQPVAYIVVLINRKKTKIPQYAIYDSAAAVENIILTAQEKGIASCWIGSHNRAALAKVLKIPANCDIDSVVALGYPDEHSKTEPFRGDVKYWKCRRGNMHIPKRSLREVAHFNKY